MKIEKMLLTKPQKTMILCAAFIIGIGAFLLNSVSLIVIFSILLISLLIYKKIFSLKFSSLFIITIIFSVFYCNFRIPKPDDLYKISPARVYLQGRVLTEPRINLKDRTKFEFQAYSYKFKDKNWTPIKAKTIVNIYDKNEKFKNILIGDALEIEGFVKPPYEATNPGQFDYKKYLKNQGVFTFTNVKHNKFKILAHPKSGKWLLIENLTRIKNKIIDENRKYIKSPKLEILEGMVFGNYAVPAPEEIKQEFIKAGLLHLLAASGMNVGFILGFWIFFASKLNVPYKPKIITGMLLIAFYSLLTGLPPSVTRAAFMMELLLLGKLLNRKADTMVLLAFACALMLLIDPLLLADIGFQLSFTTTFGILLCVPPLLEKTKPLPEILSGAVIVPLIAQLWASPIQIFHFNNFSVYSVLANILVVPFVGAITFSGFIGSIFSFMPLIGGNLCWLSTRLAEPFIDILLFVSGWVSHLPNSLYYIAKPELPAIIIFYSLVIALLFGIKKDFSSRKINNTTVVLILSLLIFTSKDTFNRKLELVFFDVGQGDAISIHTPNNKNLLVDTGPNERFSPAKAAIIPYLRHKGINKLDTIALTHSDSDHTGGTIEILKNIPTENLFHNKLDNKSKFSKKLKTYIQQNKIKNRVLSDGENIDLDKEINIKVIRPYKEQNNSKNDDSLILYISYKAFSALLMADCEAESIYDIQKYVKQPIKVIKVGHHGSSDSINYNYLDYLKPQLAVISVGKKGYKYGHPSPQVLEELKDFNVKALRTDKDHAITITSDGLNYNYEAFKSN